jgi:sec-independent protein translocase protein TatC
MPRPRVRPVGHDAQLTIVDHLDELRSRLIVCLIGLTVAVGLCFWQSERLIGVLNGPLEQASTAVSGKGRLSETAQSAVRQRDALGQLADAVGTLASNAQLGEAERHAVDRELDAARTAIEQLPTAAPARQPVTLGVAEPFSATFNVSLSLGIVLALPLILYQLYAFVVPAFSPDERRVAIPALVVAPLLFVAGAAFGFLVVVPSAVGFLQQFNSASFDILVQARDYYRFVAMLIGVMGLVFELPVLVVAINRAGVLSARQLRGVWRYAIVVAAILAALGPGTDPLTMMLMMIPLVVLYGISVVLVTLLERRDERKAAARVGVNG